MKKLLLTLVAGLLFTCGAFAQSQNQETYIYSKVEFYYLINGKCDIVVDYGQFDGKLIAKSISKLCNMDYFNSEMAAINWLSRNGWELYMYRPRLDDDIDYERYIMRMNVTGLSEEEINKRLEPLKGINFVAPQDPDGLFLAD